MSHMLTQCSPVLRATKMTMILRTRIGGKKAKMMNRCEIIQEYHFISLYLPKCMVSSIVAIEG